jgi:hypothetical protein
MDGNFKAIHLRQKHPENDVFLSDGTGCMTKREPYSKYLQAVKDAEMDAESDKELEEVNNAPG